MLTEQQRKYGRLYLFFVIALVFLRFSMLHEMVAYLFRMDTFILYLVGPPALYFMLVSGGVRRAFQNRCAIYFLCFVVWMLIAVPFSSWRGGSVETVSSYLKVNAILCPVIGGLACTWEEIKKLLVSISVAGALSVIIGFFFTGEYSGRRGLAFGVVANPDDYAAHLLLLLPLLLWIAIDSKRHIIVRLTSGLIIGLGIYLILGTASRGALIATVVAASFFLHATKTQRRVMLAVVPVSVLVLMAVVPPENLRRIVLYSDQGDLQSEEANESKEARQYLLSKSIEYTLAHPVVGVGPGQFPNYEGRHSGSEGLWHSTHNSFTQISSECGLPAFGFYFAAIASASVLLWKTYKSALKSVKNDDIALPLKCMITGFIGHFTAVTFLNFAILVSCPSIGWTRLCSFVWRSS